MTLARKCMTCGDSAATDLCIKCEQEAAEALALDGSIYLEGVAGPSSAEQVAAPSSPSLHEVPTGFNATRSTAPTWSPLLLGPDDLRGDRLRALDQRPEIRAALDAIGVRDTRDHAARVSGHDRPRSGPEFAVWKLDLLRAAGLIEPVEVPMPALPECASQAAHHLRDRFAVLLGLRALRDDGDEPAPFTKRFAAEWCGLSETTALRALGELRQHGVIVRVGEAPSRGGRSPASLYLPGPVEGEGGLT